MELAQAEHNTSSAAQGDGESIFLTNLSYLPAPPSSVSLLPPLAPVLTFLSPATFHTSSTVHEMPAQPIVDEMSIVSTIQLS